MILTLTPNPSLDLLFTAERLVWDDANRIAAPRCRPGGQGLNLVRAARELDAGGAALAIAPFGGTVGRELRAILEAEGTPLRPVDIEGQTRLFVGVRERGSGRSLLLNPRGPELTIAEGDALLAALDEAAATATTGWVVCCGSLPPGLPADFYARAGALARDRGLRFVADCDGPALAAAAPLCHLLAPNGHEAGRLVGMVVDGPLSALRAAAALHRRGSETVAITLGEAGAVGLAAGQAWWARPDLTPSLLAESSDGSAVGAGDAFLAALLVELSRGSGLEDALGRAVAAGTAALLSRGADLVLSRDVDRLVPHIVTEAL